MAENSNIEWTDHTFNPWIGCTKVSPGCANCYAATQDKFRKWTPQGWGRGRPRKRTSAANWGQPLAWNKKEGEVMVSHAEFVENRRPRVFCSSLADWLDDEVPVAWLADLLDLIRRTPNLDWLLLTKRPQNWRKRLSDWGDYTPPMETQALAYDWLRDTPPANVWIGTTVEDQARADERIPQLLAIPARVRFLSCEPLLEPVNIESNYALTGQVRRKDKSLTPPGTVAKIDWVICGGESGPGARPMHLDWARSLRDQCAAAGVAYFFKQWGEWAPVSQPGDADEVVAAVNTWPKGDWFEPDGTRGTHKTWDCIMIDRVGKKAAGRLLDGAEHSAFPGVAR